MEKYDSKKLLLQGEDTLQRSVAIMITNEPMWLLHEIFPPFNSPPGTGGEFFWTVAFAGMT
jgi:hypothetical protein